MRLPGAVRSGSLAALLAGATVGLVIGAGTELAGAAARPAVLRIMVTNDDGSGYPAKAVHGYPADTVIWAVDHHGLRQRPELVVSGINFGENVGPLATVSGTVGAAREAVALGTPAIAASQGVDNGGGPDFSEGAADLVAWVQSHRAALLAQRYRTPPSAALNVPTCTTGHVRGPVTEPLAATLTGSNLGVVDCTSTTARSTFTDDVNAFVNGYAVLSHLYP